MNLNLLQLYLYSIKQQINNILIDQLNQITFLSIFTIFIGGLFTSFSPCMISSLPLTVIYIKETKQKTIDIIVFLIGISSSLFFIGITALFLKEKYWNLFNSIPFIWSFFIILLGFNLLNIISLPNTFNYKLNTQFINSQLIQSYITGVSIGIGISPCSTPILITLIIWITTTQKLIIGFSLLVIYILGYILPIIISIIYFKKLLNSNFFQTIWIKTVKIIGCLTLSTGFFLLSHEILLII
uniref:Thiol:disulfi de interchange protein n=1 Tax=Galaxaura rugosa TaxID=268570 RepID=A0A1G4NSL9_9FLOR|nr:Thiol:disulfi de interchange protein [Galaxaura rugosa]SCW21663.1 Thiol:disulfi de interchange protein [Galaxaura rugosa]